MVQNGSVTKVMVIFLAITLVSSSFTAFSVPALASGSGAFIDDFVSSGSGGLNLPKNLLFGPDGNLYVLSFQNDKVKRYDGTTGAFIDSFVSSGSGGLDGPQGLVFGPDGNLYVSSEYTDEILRYDGTTGTFIDVFVTGASGGLNNPQESAFGPADGNLYVTSYFTHEVLRYNFTDGSFIDTFVTAGSGGLDTPQGLEFGPDGNLYVVSESSTEVLRFDGTSGSFIDVFASGGGLSTPKDLVFGPDGNLYVTSNSNDKVKRYDGATGSFIDTFVVSGSGGLDSPQGLVFGSDDALYVTSQQTDEILRYEGPFSVVNSDPIAQNDEIFTSADSMITFHVLDDNGNGADWDPDGDTLDVISVDTSGGTVGLVTLNPDNTVLYDPNGQFDFMTDTDDDTDSFDYTISDGMGGTHKATVTVTINGVDDSPTVTITTPIDGDSYVEGDTITFSGSATDPEDGGLSNIISWNSSIDGYLGIGGPLTNSSLSVGTHSINASVTDFTGNTDSDTLTITVTEPLAATVTLNVEALDSNGDVINIWTEIYHDSLLIKTGFTPFSFSVVLAEEYEIGVANFEDYIFDHWEDGSTVEPRNVTLNSDTTFTAYYNIDTDDEIVLIEDDQTTTQPVITNVEQIGSEIKITWKQEKNNLGDLPPTQGLDMSIDLPVSLADNDTFERIIDTQSSVEMGTKTVLEHDESPLVYGTNYCFEIDADWESGLIESEPVCLVFEDHDEEHEEYDQIKFLIEAVNGTANVQISKDGETTELEIEFNNAIEILNEIKHIIDLDVNDMYAEWTFEAINEEENIDISIEAKDGFADIEIVQDGETTEFEMDTTKRNTIRNEIQSVTGINLNTIDFDWTLEMTIKLFEKKVTLCHIPGGNPLNFHILSVSENSIRAHFDHGDYLGKCTDEKEELEKIELIEKIKKQREETSAKNDLKEKRDVLKEIKKDLNDSKKLLNDEEKQKIKTLVNEIKDILKKLNEDHDYEKEHKKIIKQELKETTLKIKQEMTSKEKAFKHKIDAKIFSLLKSDHPQKDAKKLGFDFKDGKTKIVIKLSEDNSEIVDYLSSLGTVDVKNDKHVQLTIKVSDLPKLNSINGIDKIRPPYSAVQFYEELSEGVYFINADLAQFAGITGEGVKAAVLDLAFSDNEKISDNVVQVKSFRQGIGFLPIQGNGDEASHGTAVAEIITDVAPDVELYLYSMETDVEFTAAVDEAISQQVDIIAMSAGWPNFPTDGTSHITKKIEEAVDNGIVFVVPAGNFANKHWEGSFVDSNFNNWHDYTDSDEGLSFTVTEERIEEEKPIIVHLMWDVGNSDVADFELVLVDPLGQIVAYSANEQLTKSDTPFEYIHHIPEVEGTYSLGVLYAGEMSKVSLRPSATLEIFSINDELEHPVSSSSVSVPADADGAIVVGAINHLDGTLEPFSSQGPTNNGKLAPHVVGPDGVTTLALDGEPFYGTSATTPYVAGLAALILQTNPDISPKELLTLIQQNTDSSLFSLKNGYDYSTGYGPANAFFLIEEQEVLG